MCCSMPSTGLRNVSLTIVGDGPLRPELDGRVAQAGLANVRLTGRLPDVELRNAYASHDVIVLPSTTTAEAYGLVLAEGMAAGCVPVASALPGVSELARDTGLLVRPGDSPLPAVPRSARSPTSHGWWTSCPRHPWSALGTCRSTPWPGSTNGSSGLPWRVPA